MDYILFKIIGDFWGLKSKIVKKKGPLKRLFMFLYKLYLFKTNSYIGHNTTFLSKPIFPHGVKSIFISGDAVIGKKCIIYQQVTIGSNTLPDSKGFGSPVIGDNCLIGAGAIIIGNVIIGNNCRIAANVTVSKNIPDNSLVVGEFPKVISKNQIDNNLYFRSSKSEWMFYDDNGNTCKVVDSELLNKLNQHIN